MISFIGVAILSMGTTFLRGGLDSFTAVNTGISNKLGIGLGVYQLAVNLVIFIFILWLDRKQIGIGTILNMVLVGFEIQWFTTIYHQLFGYRTTFLIVAADTLIGLILFTLGASLYMAPDLGAAPYDAIAPIITQRTKSYLTELLESHKTFYSWSLPLCFCRTLISVLITLSITRCKRLKRCVTTCLNTQLLI